MKIGILTFHNTMNYGSFLQTLGLYNTVISLGYECEVIDYECRAIEAAEIPQFKLESLSVRKLVKFFLVTRKLKRKYEGLMEDRKKFLKLSPRYTKDTIKIADQLYDAFLVGSDILWDLKLTGNDLTYFLDFVENSDKKFSFATSIGGEWSTEQVEQLGQYISSFRRISLREESSCEWLRTKFQDKAIDAVCDPTMLCNSSYWAELAENGREYGIKGYVIVYFPSDEIVKNAKEYARKRHLKVVCIGTNYNYPELRHVVPESVCDWIRLISEADAVFTASYHGLLFGLYFHKTVYAYYRNNKGHNIRVKDILTYLGIENECNYSKGSLQKIDYGHVDSCMDRRRRESLKVLNDYWSDNDRKQK